MADLVGHTSNDKNLGLKIKNLYLRGPKGEDGVGIVSWVMNADYTFTLTLTDGRVFTSESLKGPKGDSVEYDDSDLKREINNRYTKEEVDELISKIPIFSLKIVDELPQKEIDENAIYFLRKKNSKTYDKYVYIANEWDLLNNVDLSNYYTKKEVEEAIDKAIASITDGDEEDF